MTVEKQSGIITLLSDFGTGSGYAAAMKGVILKITGPEIHVIDLSHEVPRHEIRAGAFLLWAVAPYFPRGTVHVAVVDPGVGTERRGLIVAAGGQYLVGPDNGLLFPAAERLGLEAVYKIHNRKYMLPDLSATFHGRDIFAPVGAHLARGVPPAEIGEQITEWTELRFGSGQQLDNALRGQVIYIDSFGNVVTNISRELAERLLSPDREAEIKVMKNRFRARFHQAYALAQEEEVLLLIGSHGNLELAVNRGNAAENLGIELGDELEIRSAKRDEC
jgi:hypothetical protein